VRDWVGVEGVGVRRLWVERRILARVRRGGREVKRLEEKFRSRDWTRVGRSDVWFDIICRLNES